MLVWGIAIEPRLILDVREEVAVIPQLPLAWEGAEVAVISDLQLGSWLDNEGMARRAVQELSQRRPALVPTFAVLGNHDYAMEQRDAPQLPRAAAVVAEELEAIGVIVLDNASKVVPSPGRRA